MAPKRRRPTNTKGGLSQMDAALAAMSPYGFSTTVIRRTVQHLLNVHGHGHEAWVSIKDSSYALLIHQLLDSSPEPANQLPIKAKDIVSATSEAGGELLLKADDIPSSETGNQLPVKAMDTVPATTEAGAELLIKADDISTTKAGNQLPIKAVDTPLATRGTENQVLIKATDTVSADNEFDSNPAPSPSTKSSQPVGKHCHKKRRPSHGLISSDNDEEDLIELPTAPLSMVYGSNKDSDDEDSDYALFIDKLLDSSQATDGMTEDNPGDAPNEASSAGCSNITLLPCSSTPTSDGTPLINQPTNTVSASSETANQLPIKAMDTVPATTEAGSELLTKYDDIPSSETGNQLPIKAMVTVPATTEAGSELLIKADDIPSSGTDNQLPIKAMDTVPATTEAGAELVIKADDISTTKAGNQLPIKAVDTPLATRGTENQVLIKATDTVSADNEFDSNPAPSPSTKSSQPVGKHCHKKRRPSHGLISSDNDEEDLIELPTAPLSMVYGSNKDSDDVDSDYALFIDKLLDSSQATDDLTEDNPGDGPNEASYADDTVSASSETGNQPPIKSMDIVSATSEAVAELLMKADDISSGETGNQLPIKALETISATTEAGAQLFIKADEISTSETGNQLPIKAVGTPSATSEAYAELLIKADDISTSEAGNQLSIKAVDTPSATRVTGNQVPIKATDTGSADNESDCKPAPSPLTKSSRPVGKHCHKKRRPCHGWISYDNDEEDLIELPPAPLSMALLYMQAK